MRILIAEDEYDIALLYKTALEERNHHIVITKNGEECLKVYHEEFQRLRLETYIQGSVSPFDVIILDHKMPKINGMDVAEEILAVNSHQRIIFASAYVKETLIDSIRHLKQVVELMQKPFTISKLIDTIEDEQVYMQLRKLNVDIDVIKAINPTHEQIMDLLQGLRKTEKGSSNFLV
jgi:CheY-like chemotaxis protein